nr:glycosyltransferase [Chiayiivirga flava]
MQNVESDLWAQVGRARWRFAPLRFEAARLRRDEARALAACACTVALTQRDAHALRALAPGARIVAIPPPFPATLDAGAPRPGAPALAVAGSAGWWPNRQGTRWCVQHVAPLLHAAVSDARLHVFGGTLVAARGVVWHRAPADARTAFPAGAIALVPLHIGSGIRMRILEAFARGLPVIATSTAAAGLQVVSGRELLIADTPEATVAAVGLLAGDPSLGTALVGNGSDYLRRMHDSAVLTAELVAVYRAAAERA